MQDMKCFFAVYIYFLYWETLLFLANGVHWVLLFKEREQNYY